MQGLFKTWLLRENYRASTARKSARDVEKLRRRFNEGQKVSQSAADVALLQRYQGFIKEIGSCEDNFDRWVKKQPLGPRKRLVAKRRAGEPKRAFTEEDWKRLLEKLRNDTTPEGTVLYLMAVTGHRIGDILRLSRATLKAGLFGGVIQLERKGGSYVQVPVAGAAAPWRALRKRWKQGDTVAEWICPDSELGAEAAGGAYQRVRRHLQNLAKQLGLSGQLNLHRLRRTVGVRALKKTGDIHAVSQLLGHRSIQSTEQYVNELRTEEIAELQRQLLEE